jgi:hypothetical protein
MQFGVPLLFSGDFVSCLSPWVRGRVRQIDCVLVKGSNQPVALFTYDVSLDLVGRPGLPSGPQHSQHSWDSPAGLEEEAEEQERMWREYGDEWAENPDLITTWAITPQFKEVFDRGFTVGVSLSARG